MRLINTDVLKDFAYINKGNFNTVEGIREWIDNAPTVPQINIFCENADEKAIADMKEELQKVIDDLRPQGEWTDLSTDGRHIGWIACSVCGQEPPNESNLRTNYCPNCGAKMEV